jgi:hypothetical protein
MLSEAYAHHPSASSLQLYEPAYLLQEVFMLRGTINNLRTTVFQDVAPCKSTPKIEASSSSETLLPIY